MTPIEELDKLIAEAAKRPFVPFIAYDEKMDRLSIEMRDCSICEVPIVIQAHLLIDNHPQPGEGALAGIAFDGARKILKAIGLDVKDLVPTEGSYENKNGNLTSKIDTSNREDVSEDHQSSGDRTFAGEFGHP